MPPHEADRPLLALAAESLAATPGRLNTVVDVLQGQALRHYSEALRQYLSLRIGNPDVAETALSELRALVAAWRAEDLVAPPGVRANLFHAARKLSFKHAETRAPLAAGRTLLWRKPHKSLSSDEGRDRLRADPDAELLELRFARELKPEEIAHVMSQPLQSVQQRLELAETRAMQLLGLKPDKQDAFTSLSRALLEAFSIEAPQSRPEPTLESEPHSVEPGTLIGGRFKIDQRVGAGAFGDVYRALDNDVPGHVVALKLLHQASPSDVARAVALRELRHIASVFHPSVVQFKDHGWFEGRLWFVMPWYEGETLEARMDREPLSRQEALQIFVPLARALVAMHSAGIRHQDIKPENIFLAKIQGQEVLPVLLDLGVAAKEAEMVVAGTPTYFAPEVAAQFAMRKGRGAITSKADIFSLALSLRNALEPSSQETVVGGAVESFVMMRSTEMPELPGSKDLHFLAPTFKRWLSPDPERRPTAEEFSQELEILTQPEVNRARRRAVLRWAVPIAVGVLAVGSATFFVLTERAAEQARKARAAKAETAIVRTELGEESERRKALEENTSRLRTEIESSNLSRQELVSQLASAQGRLASTSEDLSRSMTREGALRNELNATTVRATQLSADLLATQDSLRQSEARGANLTDRLATATADLEATRVQLATTQSELLAARGELESTRGELTQARGDLASTRTQLEAERARAITFEAKVQDLEQDKARLNDNVERLERRIAGLENDLERERNRPAPTPGPAPSPVPPSP